MRGTCVSGRVCVRVAGFERTIDMSTSRGTPSRQRCGATLVTHSLGCSRGGVVLLRAPVRVGIHGDLNRHRAHTNLAPK